LPGRRVSAVTRQSIIDCKLMDARVKPAHDEENVDCITRTKKSAPENRGGSL
jgi:hypothetical protein